MPLHPRPGVGNSQFFEQVFKVDARGYEKDALINGILCDSKYHRMVKLGAWLFVKSRPAATGDYVRRPSEFGLGAAVEVARKDIVDAKLIEERYQLLRSADTLGLKGGRYGWRYVKEDKGVTIPAEINVPELPKEGQAFLIAPGRIEDS
jgi:hypothetical protein